MKMINISTEILIILSQGITQGVHFETTITGYGIIKLTAYHFLLHSNCFCWVLRHQPKTLSCSWSQFWVSTKISLTKYEAMSTTSLPL